jgi:hypothetical protein
MPPFITDQSIYFASVGAENNPLDRAFGKLAGIGGGGGGGAGEVPAPRIIAAFDFDIEDRLPAILSSI